MGGLHVDVLNMQCVMFIVVLDMCCYVSKNEGEEDRVGELLFLR